MISYERKIDALGGTSIRDTDYDNAYNDGHSEAVKAATEIAEEADAMIGELIETLDRILNPSAPLTQTLNDAETLLRRIRSRQS